MLSVHKKEYFFPQTRIYQCNHLQPSFIWTGQQQQALDFSPMVKQEYKPDTDPWRKKITFVCKVHLFLNFVTISGATMPATSKYYVKKITIKFINCDIFGTSFLVASSEKQQSHSIGLTIRGVNCHLSVISLTVATYSHWLTWEVKVNLGDKQHMTISTK